MKKFKIKLRRAEAEGMSAHIVSVIEWTNGYDDDDGKMLAAALAQVYRKIEEKLLTVKPVYSITLTPVEAFALRILNRDFQSANVYINNSLLQLTNKIHQHYS